jgi:hypothetical protein
LLTAFSSNPSWLNYEPFHFAHLLRTQRGAAEIVRGKTIWKLKKSSHIQANELWNPEPYPIWWALKSLTHNSWTFWSSIFRDWYLKP